MIWIIEFKTLVKIFIPVFFVHSVRIITGIVDLAIVSRYSVFDLAGIGLASSIQNTIIIIGVGVFVMIAADVAKAKARQTSSTVVFQYLQQYTILGLAFSLVLMIFMLLVAFFMHDFIHHSKMIIVTERYLLVSSLAVPGIMLFIIMREFLQALGNNKALVCIAIFMLVANASFDYLFVYGVWFFPELGGVGCAVAGVVSNWLGFLLLYTYIRKRYQESNMFKLKIYGRLLKKIFRISSPNGFSFLVEGSMFDIISLMLVGLGYIVIGTHSILMTITNFVYFAMSGIAQAILIRAGYYAGLKQHRGVLKVTLLGAILAMITLIIIVVLLTCFGHGLFSFYTENNDILKLALLLVPYMSFFVIFEGTGVILGSFLKIYNKTDYIFKSFLLSYWFLGVPFAAYVIFIYGYSHKNVYNIFSYVWLLLVVIMAINASILFFRCRVTFLALFRKTS